MFGFHTPSSDDFRHPAIACIFPRAAVWVVPTLLAWCLIGGRLEGREILDELEAETAPAQTSSPKTGQGEDDVLSDLLGGTESESPKPAAPGKSKARPTGAPLDAFPAERSSWRIESARESPPPERKPLGLAVRATFLAPGAESKEPYDETFALGLSYAPPRAANRRLSYEVSVDFAETESDLGESRLIIVRGTARYGLGEDSRFYLLGGLGYMDEDVTDNKKGKIDAKGGLLLDLGAGARVWRRLHARLMLSLLAGSDNARNVVGLSLEYRF